MFLFCKKIFAAAIAAGLSCGLTASAETILLVPQDDRPVSMAYTVSTAERAGYTVLTPPSSYLCGNDRPGNPDKLWDWINSNISRADACVFSTDSLIYGGLVDSRRHNDSLATLLDRENMLETLHKSYPKVPIYAFGTIMRTPAASNGSVEPYYYGNYGQAIYQISVLQDKADLNQLSSEDVGKLLALKLSVPVEYLQDWYDRRTKNVIISKHLINDTKNGTFTYFCLGHDDNGKYSQSAMESRYLTKESSSLPSSSYGSFPGADQLALLLIARYYVDIHKLSPSFSVIYPLGGAEDTIPSYDSQPVGLTISQQIKAVGGRMAGKQVPDILLAVNTPLDTSTGESEEFANFAMPKKSTIDFVSRIQDAINRNISVAVADIYFSNGSDNTLMSLLKKDDLLYRVSSYDGWNTASNTLGYSIAQAVLSPAMSKKDHRLMLTEQYIDNWAYQANVRKNIYRMQDTIPIGPIRYYSVLPPILQQEMVYQVQQFAKKNLNADPRTISADFPWNRLFEIHAYVADSPKYPLAVDPLAPPPAPVKDDASHKTGTGTPASPTAAPITSAPAST